MHTMDAPRHDELFTTCKLSVGVSVEFLKLKSDLAYPYYVLICSDACPRQNSTK